ncbi:MAG: hypothetical protein A2X19_10050 [Bacteroidetes bacterium GWE2_39_28]|nr:MAG: hypothetical protein A2X19_10050 [Bacteroidetes bacterium GWE2_39_28]OFY15986.1 MAG: hypothetical protein A2X16_01095 [Bacteroidetes bacterium GWF2_39_10]OFZ07802.1 MAG: hypothetical protein A2322_02760 [Bacteroidetes bacterium RIFOXYB2_FULL_39_7]OFZ10933.1 MAG: hypothetical protein A2465_00970 [Bacteroidetes bacterium RIFOXYC2_FULL_39_11]HCT95242.1 hypothetical protein [Rikenellaceae bacterium]
MKNKIYTISALLISAFALFAHNAKAQERIQERIYLSTDRDSYLAGETLWISLYCLDISKTPKLSPLSSIAYVEIQNSTSVVLTAKIFLIDGRGSGHISLPPVLATGNYRILAYTKQMLNESTPQLFEKVIPIFNVLTSEKVPGNVEIATENSAVSANEQKESGLSLSALGTQNAVEVKFGQGGRILPLNSSVPITLSNTSNTLVSLNVTVVKVDSLPVYNTMTVSNFKSNISHGVFSQDNLYVPEYEGEIIKGKVTLKGTGSLWDKIIFLSAVGENAEVYSSVVDSTGTFNFYTNSFFGDREIVLEIPSADSTYNFTYELNDPFIKKIDNNIPKLILDRKFEQSLSERSIEMQIGRRFGIDTLYDRLPFHNDPLLRTKPVVYKLDDYTRFPVMPEVMIEYITELRFRKLDGRQDLQMRWEDSYKTLSYSRGNTLVLLDGIPVFDHTKIFNYDPLKVKSISIYGSEFFVGYASFEGLVLFKTYKGDYSGLTFGRNVRIMDFQGALIPSKFTANGIAKADNFPDMRSLLYWDPQIDLKPGVSSDINIHTSSLPGKYIIKIEGFTENGLPVEYSSEFTVR